MRSFFAIALLCAMPSLAFAAVQVSASPAATECVPRLRAARAELHAKDIATLSVRFERNGGVFSALVQGDNYERRIMDRQCDALARAVAIMLATVEDAEAPQPAPASAPAPQPVAVGVIETPPPAPIAPRARVSLSAGAALSIPT